MSEITEEMSFLAGSWIVRVSTIANLSSAGVTQICQANPLRWGLTLGSSITNTSGSTVIFVAPFTMGGTVAAPLGYRMSTGQPVMTFNYRDNPGLTIAPWFAVGTGALCTMIVWEELAQQ